MQGPDIFISYAREDVGMARLFASAFAREGFNVWWDAAIHSGESFDEVIEKSLRAARAVVVLWSPRSVGSRWVRAEATLADRNKTLAPVVIEKCDRPIIFELTHTVDLSHWSGDTHDNAWQVFLQDVHRLVTSDRPASNIAPAAPGGNQPGHSRMPQPAQQHDRHAPGGGPPQHPGESLDNSKMDNLISMLSSLQEAMKGGHAPAQPTPAPTPPPAPTPAPAHSAPVHAKQAPPPEPAADDDEDDDDDSTQFFTSSDHFRFMEGDEFHCLELLVRDGEVEKRYPVGPLGLKIGRSAPADVVLADSKVSRSHCLVELKEDELFVTDLNSTNGTYVDGKRVTGAALVPVGSVLTIGSYELVHQVRNRAEV